LREHPGVLGKTAPASLCRLNMKFPVGGGYRGPDWKKTGRLSRMYRSFLRTLLSLSGKAVAQKQHSAEIRPTSHWVRPQPGQ
jgi:hypothetical protein